MEQASALIAPAMSSLTPTSHAVEEPRLRAGYLRLSPLR